MPSFKKGDRVAYTVGANAVNGTITAILDSSSTDGQTRYEVKNENTQKTITRKEIFLTKV